MELVILGEWIEKPRTYIVSSLRPSCIFWITEFNVVEWNIKVQPMQNLCQQSSVHGKLVRCQNLTFYDNIGRLLGQLLKSNERKLYIQSLWFYNLFHCKILFGFHIFLCHAYFLVYRHFPLSYFWFFFEFLYVYVDILGLFLW